VPIVLKYGSLNLLEPSGPVQACNGIALPFTSQNIIIQGDSREKMMVSIIVRKKFYEHVSNSKWLPR